MSGSTPSHGKLIEAARDGNVTLIADLLNRGANIEERDSDGDTPLNEAARKGQVDAVRFLIQKGALLASPNTNGRTASSWAERNGHTDVLEILRAAKQDLLKPKQKNEWVLMGTDRVAHVCVFPETAKKLTDIFNFTNRERVLISDDLDTKASAMTPVTSFDDLPADIYRKAFEEFTKLGGKADEAFIFRGVRLMDKQTKLG